MCIFVIWKIYEVTYIIIIIIIITGSDTFKTWMYCSIVFAQLTIMYALHITMQ